MFGLQRKASEVIQMPDWDRINVKKRWEILQGQTLNMAWNDIIAEQQQSR